MLEILVKASDASEMMGGESFFTDDPACSIASPANTSVESSVARTYSWAGLGFPRLSDKDRTTSNCQTISLGMANHQREVTCLDSVVSVEVQADALVRSRSCQGTRPPAV